jgi:tRNA threonylcarbamoyladenosine biosynthesis protein TsaB
MLILGMKPATEQVSVAIGGHEGVLAMFEVCAVAGMPRPDPLIEFVCKQADIEMSEFGASPLMSARAVHRHARRARR